mmetsp:Transcript_30490/g.55453  ORF Transcript_30490/g.55453 Transcript_30490/m.55453 type:complete len:237 (+) Transcript_30490:983-1693(+)
MSDASFATSVPAMPMAIPMSACFKAGASFTPSPVIAAISPNDFKILTIICLCFGSVRENTAPSTSLFVMIFFRTFVFSSSERSSNSFPEYEAGCGLALEVKIPRSLAIASAVVLLSPVIMMTLIPAIRHSRIASLHSGRGGSRMPTMPTNVMSCSMLMNCSGSESNLCVPLSYLSRFTSLRSVLTAKAMVRRAAFAMVSTSVLTALVQPSSSFSTEPLGRRILVHLLRIISGAPLA